jgi:hypothetical protein
LARVEFNRLEKPLSSEEVVWATEVGEPRRGVMVARTLVPDEPSNLRIRVVNVLDHSILMDEGTPMCNLVAVQEVSPVAGTHD